MWEQSLLTSSAQVAALRLLSEWWDSSSRRVRGRWRLAGAPGAPAATDERPVAAPGPAPTAS